MEGLMLDLMYEVPSQAENISSILITEDSVSGKAKPVMKQRDNEEVA
jgi:ATP-dependent protease Clp ATPase subunit